MFSADPSRCEACSAGTFSTGLRAVVCAACERGLFQNRSGASGCAACVRGTYSNATGASQCDACPANTDGPVGSTTITECSANAGYFAQYTRTIEAIVTMPASEYDPATFVALIQAAAGPGAVVSVN
jgi:hypothetical protein